MASFHQTQVYANILDSYESFILAPGEKKVEMKLDTRMYIQINSNI